MSSALKELLAEQRGGELQEKGVGGTSTLNNRDYLESVSPALLSDDPPPNSIARIEPKTEVAQIEAPPSSGGELVNVGTTVALQDYKPRQSKLRVTDSLKLTLDVLRRNGEVGGRLSEDDQLLISEISKFMNVKEVSSIREEREAQAAAEAKGTGDQLPEGLVPAKIHGL